VGGKEKLKDAVILSGVGEASAVEESRRTYQRPLLVMPRDSSIPLRSAQNDSGWNGDTVLGFYQYSQAEANLALPGRRL